MMQVHPAVARLRAVVHRSRAVTVRWRWRGSPMVANVRAALARFDAGDGRLITAISGCKQASQQMMALGVLGALAHRGGLSMMEQLAHDTTAQRDLRWEALRQVLALDAARGLALLALWRAMQVIRYPLPLLPWNDNCARADLIWRR